METDKNSTLDQSQIDTCSDEEDQQTLNGGNDAPNNTAAAGNPKRSILKETQINSNLVQIERQSLGHNDDEEA